MFLKQLFVADAVFGTHPTMRELTFDNSFGTLVNVVVQLKDAQYICVVAKYYATTEQTGHKSLFQVEASVIVETHITQLFVDTIYCGCW